MNILFVCSRNQWRSPTAEQIWREHDGLSVKSAGTSRQARKTINAELIRWADVICVMEQKHKNCIMAKYYRLVEYKKIHVLDITDDYTYMDPNLIKILNYIVPHRLGLIL